MAFFIQMRWIPFSKGRKYDEYWNFYQEIRKTLTCVIKTSANALPQVFESSILSFFSSEHQKDFLKIDSVILKWALDCFPNGSKSKEFPVSGKTYQDSDAMPVGDSFLRNINFYEVCMY